MNTLEQNIRFHKVNSKKSEFELVKRKEIKNHWILEDSKRKQIEVTILDPNIDQVNKYLDDNKITFGNVMVVDISIRKNRVLQKFSNVILMTGFHPKDQGGLL